MKKIGLLIVGIIIGAGLTLSPQIYGAGAKLLGAKVDKTLDIKLNGNSIGQGAVIDGTSYLPVRAAANALGLEVSVDSTQVNLQGKSNEELAEIAQKEQAEMDKVSKISSLEIKIKLSKQKIESLESAITGTEKTVSSRLSQLNAAKANSQISEEILNRAQINYDDAVKAVDTNKANLAAEQANLASLEAQLAELQK
ncbi:hypothetical protein D3C71_971630 [compost metagenome]